MKKHIFATLLALCSLGLVACGGPSGTEESSSQPTSGDTSSPSSGDTSGTTQAELASITLSGAYRTEYYVDEPYDPVGLIVTANYSDSTSKRVTDFEVSGFDSSVVNPALELTVSYTEATITKTAKFTVAIVGEPEAVKVGVVLKVNVTGISEYTGGHQNIFINGTFAKDGDNWGTQKLTQDAENPNLWTISYTEIEVDQAYSFNFYYGGETSPDWTRGKNLEYTAKDTNWSVLIEEDDAVEGVVTKTYSASFNVPTTVEHNVTVKASPVVQAEAEGAEVGLADGVKLFAWNNITNSTIAFEKQEDGSWTKEFTVDIDLSTEVGLLTCTFVLGLESEDWQYQMGEYENGVWTKWGQGVQFDVKESDEVITYTPRFNSQPTPPSADDYTLAVTVTFEAGSTFTGCAFDGGYTTSDTGVAYVNNPCAWMANLSENEGIYTAIIRPAFDGDSLDFYFSIQAWRWIEGGEDNWAGDSYVGASTEWVAFHVQFDSANRVATVNISAPALTAGQSCVAGTITSSTNLTIV